jgi:hypothetical protein
MARSFLARHHASPVLLLPNAWDALSARIFVAAGFDAVATTSGGVAWALGYPDGEHTPWAEGRVKEKMGHRSGSRSDARGSHLQHGCGNLDDLPHPLWRGAIARLDPRVSGSMV